MKDNPRIMLTSAPCCFNFRGSMSFFQSHLFVKKTLSIKPRKKPRTKIRNTDKATYHRPSGMNQATGRYSYQCSLIIFDLYIKILSKERIKLFKHCFLLLFSIHFAASEYGHRRQNLRNGDTSCRNKAIGKGLSNEFLCFLRT